jgi:aryl-alcohol dehydrogenase-like predicted oxidoreductase
LIFISPAEDNSGPLEDVIETIVDLIKEGKVHYLGISVYAITIVIT